MLTEFVRDHAFTIAWFGLMTMVWLGWAQEDPPKSWRPWLGVGSGLGIVFAGVFASATVLRWGEGGALDENWLAFAILVWAEVIAGLVAALVLVRRKQKRWMAWWIALIVALHFVPLAFILGDLSLILLGAVQLVGLFLVVPRLRRSEGATATLAGPVMGVTLLVFAVVSTIVFLLRYGSPWP